jgi:hypothetical protein
MAERRDPTAEHLIKYAESLTRPLTPPTFLDKLKTMMFPIGVMLLGVGISAVSAAMRYQPEIVIGGIVVGVIGLIWLGSRKPLR